MWKERLLAAGGLPMRLHDGHGGAELVLLPENLPEPFLQVHAHVQEAHELVGLVTAQGLHLRGDHVERGLDLAVLVSECLDSDQGCRVSGQELRAAVRVRRGGRVGSRGADGKKHEK